MLTGTIVHHCVCGRPAGWPSRSGRPGAWAARSSSWRKTWANTLWNDSWSRSQQTWTLSGRLPRPLTDHLLNHNLAPRLPHPCPPIHHHHHHQHWGQKQKGNWWWHLKWAGLFRFKLSPHWLTHLIYIQLIQSSTSYQAHSNLLSFVSFTPWRHWLWWRSHLPACSLGRQNQSPHPAQRQCQDPYPSAALESKTQNYICIWQFLWLQAFYLIFFYENIFLFVNQGHITIYYCLVLPLIYFKM